LKNENIELNRQFEEQVGLFLLCCSAMMVELHNEQKFNFTDFESFLTQTIELREANDKIAHLELKLSDTTEMLAHQTDSNSGKQKNNTDRNSENANDDGVPPSKPNHLEYLKDHRKRSSSQQQQQQQPRSVF
jgi:hypothetical protein